MHNEPDSVWGHSALHANIKREEWWEAIAGLSQRSLEKLILFRFYFNGTQKQDEIYSK